MPAPTVDSLRERYAPLTQAEAERVLRLVGEGQSEEDAVTQVKSERVGPAASWEDVEPAPAPVAEEVEALREAVDEASQREIATSDDYDAALSEAAQVKDEVEHVAAYLAEADQTGEAQANEGVLSDAEIADGGAHELAAYVKRFPEEADRVTGIESTREGGGRKTVLDAAKAAKEQG